MNLSHLSDSVLVENLKSFVKTERETLTSILHHLIEVERRRLFSKFKCESIHHYAMKELGYTENEAGVRIRAMRLLKDLPSIEEKITSGKLSLTNMVMAQTLFNHEKKADVQRTSQEKIELLEKIENATKHEAASTIEKESFISQKLMPRLDFEETGVDMHLFANGNLQAKLKRLFEVKSRENPNMKLHELVDLMADLALEKWDPVEKARRSIAKRKRRALNLAEKIQAGKVTGAGGHFTETIKTSQLPFPERPEQKSSRNIPAAAKHAVYIRDRGCCCNCGSSSDVQVDHINPYAMGGSHELSNLRLLCRSCNQRHAINSYGTEKMSSYLKSQSRRYLN